MGMGKLANNFEGCDPEIGGGHGQAVADAAAPIERYALVQSKYSGGTGLSCARKTNLDCRPSHRLMKQDGTRSQPRPYGDIYVDIFIVHRPSGTSSQSVHVPLGTRCVGVAASAAEIHVHTYTGLPVVCSRVTQQCCLFVSILSFLCSLSDFSSAAAAAVGTAANSGCIRKDYPNVFFFFRFEGLRDKHPPRAYPSILDSSLSPFFGICGRTSRGHDR